jgi:Xaa-Pro aminopeptidase
MTTGHFKKISGLIQRRGLDAFFVNDPATLFYLSGSPLTGYSVLIAGQKILVISARMLIGQLEKVYAGAELIAGRNIADGLKKALKRIPAIKSLGFDPERTSFALYEKLLRKAGPFRLKSEPGLVDDARAVKTADEIEAIKCACGIAAGVMRAASGFIKPGESEVSVAARINRMFIEMDAEAAFPTIVAGGRNSAYPHHVNTGEKLPENGHVIVDLGCRYRGYCSDLTRVIFLGKISPIFRRYYDCVQSARKAVFKTLRPGVKTGDVDRAARAVLSRTGLGGLFIHSTGHGIGIEVHEKPSVSRGGADVLRPGMVLTIEPGVYRKGAGGIRIEDTVLITKNGCEILTKGA